MLKVVTYSTEVPLPHTSPSIEVGHMVQDGHRLTGQNLELNFLLKNQQKDPSLLAVQEFNHPCFHPFHITNATSFHQGVRGAPWNLQVHHESHMCIMGTFLERSLEYIQESPGDFRTPNSSINFAIQAVAFL